MLSTLDKKKFVDFSSMLNIDYWNIMWTKSVLGYIWKAVFKDWLFIFLRNCISKLKRVKEY